MKYPIPIIILGGILITGSPLPAQDNPDRPTRDPATWVWNVPIPKPHMMHGTIESASMHRTVGYNIYLPPGYADRPDMRYPVVYYLHGATGTEASDTGVISYVIPEIEKGNIGPVIYVFVNAGQFSGYRDRPEDNVMAETCIIRELIPEIDKRYRTLTGQKGRALMGFSMGGGGGIRLALKYPEMFCAVVSISGAVDRLNPSESPSDGVPAVDSPDNAYRWATENQDRVRGYIEFFITTGAEERLYNRQPPFIAHLHDLKIDFNYRVQAHLDHNLGKSLPLFAREAVLFLASQYQQAQ